MQVKHEPTANLVQSDVAESRLNACKLCDKFTGHICQQTETNIIVNVVFEQETCPLNKW